MNIIITIFWGVLLLCLVVFIHEAGHFLAARLQGIRVTEFFLGMPCRWRLSRRSKRYGTRYGITPILLGGYTQICGMAGEPPKHMAAVLASLMARGRASAAEIAQDVGCAPEEALDALVALGDWASVEPYYDPLKGEKPSQSTYPEQFQTVERDAHLLTRYDRGNDFSLPGATAAGDPQTTDLDPQAFLEREKSHTYLGDGLWGRLAMLVAGVCINIVFGIFIVVVALMTYGISAANLESTQVGSVEPQSIAAQVGLEAGDTITLVAGEPVDNWEALSDALHQKMSSPDAFDITYERDGAQKTLTVPQDRAGATTLGISAPTEQIRLGFGEAIAYTFNYLGMVAQMIAQLLQPAHVGEVISSSTSIVGITVMAGQAASQGIIPYVLIAASVSISLGFVNLLPIPPLDGGKVVIEIVQAIIGRPLPEKFILAFNYVGIGLFLLLFFVLLQQDLFRFVLGGS